jgi:transcriptional regulator with XRE-family HTH domain
VLDERVAAPPISITETHRRNIRAQRAALRLTQASVAKRMNQLGYAWYPQTVGLVERDQRPLSADELVALALCLETTPDVLFGPVGGASVVVFGDQQIPAQRLRIIDDSLSWDGDTLKVSAPTIQYRPTEVVMAVHEAREKLRRQADGEDQEGAAGEQGPQQEEGFGAWTEDIPPRRPDPREGGSR